MDDDRKIQQDEHLQSIGNMHSHSMYGNDFQNWGKLENKLVLKRPEEKYYKMKFRGSSTFATEHKKVIDNVKMFKK
jgi:hypothetical protein